LWGEAFYQAFASVSTQLDLDPNVYSLLLAKPQKLPYFETWICLRAFYWKGIWHNVRNKDLNTRAKLTGQRPSCPKSAQRRGNTGKYNRQE
jgi:hypothetical protein